MHIVGKRLRFLRDQNQLTQADIAKIVGVSRITVTNWETGRAEPFFEAVVKLADYFEVTVDYLLGRDNPPPRPEQTTVTFKDGRQIPFSQLTPDEQAAIESVWRLVSARLEKQDSKKQQQTPPTR